MSFLGSASLMAGLGAAAVSIPVILHFFFRSRYRTVPWAAMKFLLTSIEQTSRRLRFQEILLLLLRMAVLALLAFALTRPISALFNDKGQGEAVDAVFVFDTSLSMSAREGDETRLDKAKAAAIEIIDKLPPYSTVQIITCADRAELLGPRVPANLDQAKHLIHQRVEQTDLRTDFLPGAQAALKVLKRRQLSNKELYIFSDMQKSAWEAQTAALKETLTDVQQQATIYLIHCGRRNINNIAITGITPQEGIPRPGERVGFAVLVKNTSNINAKNLQVSLLIDGDDKTKESRSIKALPAGETRAVTLSAKMGEEGLHVVTAIVKQDDLNADNRFDRVIAVRDAARILLIDGKYDKANPPLSSSYFLGHALWPVKDEQKKTQAIQLTLTTSQQVVPGMLKDFDLCVLTDVAVKQDLERRVPHLSAEFLDDLNRFVRRGHGLLIFVGDNVRIKDYNEQLVRKRHLLPFEFQAKVKQDEKSLLFVNRLSANLPILHKIRDDKLFVKFNQLPIWQSIQLKEPNRQTPNGKTKTKKQIQLNSDGVVVALRYTNGRAALVTNQVDAGEVWLFTTAAYPGVDPKTGDTVWSDLSFGRPYTPLVQMSATYLLNQQAQTHNTVAGNKLTWLAPSKEQDHSYTLYQPNGKKQNLGMPEMKADRPLLTLKNLYQAGVYRLVTRDPKAKGSDITNDPLLVEQLRKGKLNIGRPFAVTPDLAETIDLTSMKKEQIDTLLGFPVVHASAATDPGNFAGMNRTNREWTWWLLLAVLCFTVGEGALAWLCGRPI